MREILAEGLAAIDVKNEITDGVCKMKEEKLNPEDFHMIAEWEAHEGTWLQWPHDDQWPGYQLEQEKTWLLLLEALHEHENVHIIIQDERRREHVEQQLEFFAIGLENIDFHIIPTNDVWVCDDAPAFVVNKERRLALVNWRFNGWGDRYEHEMDNLVPLRVAKELGMPAFSPPLTLEGGFELNGKGTLMATRSSIINPNRNPGKTQEDIEKIIKKYLGVKHFIWLTGMSGDDPELGPEDTDCHVDLEARFVNASTVLYSWPEDRTSAWFRRVTRIHIEELKEATTESGKPLTLIPMPGPKHPFSRASKIETAGIRAKLARSQEMIGGYLDWHVANGVVLVPVYGDTNDDRALKIVGEHFPHRDVVGIDCRGVWENGGGIHCITKTQPVSSPWGP